MARTYRRLEGRDAWHFCSNCSNWPKRPDKYEEQSTKPTSGELDNECRSKQSNGNCDD